MKLTTLAYIRHNGKTLMIHRNKRPQDYHLGKWNGLGGKFEIGESPEQCLEREVLEESGLTVEKAHLHGVITFPVFDGVQDTYTFIYSVSAFSGTLLHEVDEGSLHWIDDDKLLELNLWEGDRVFMPWLQEKRFFSAIFRYDEGKFQDYEVTFYG